MTIRKTLDAGWVLFKKALVAVGNGSDAIWGQPAAGATQPATQKSGSDQNIDSIWGAPADTETMWDSPSGVDTAAKQTIPTELPGGAESSVVVELRVSTQQGGAGIPPALQAPLSTETPLGATPQKKNVRGKEPTLDEILPVPDGW